MIVNDISGFFAANGGDSEVLYWNAGSITPALTGPRGGELDPILPA